MKPPEGSLFFLRSLRARSPDEEDFAYFVGGHPLSISYGDRQVDSAVFLSLEVTGCSSSVGYDRYPPGSKIEAYLGEVHESIAWRQEQKSFDPEMRPGICWHPPFEEQAHVQTHAEMFNAAGLLCRALASGLV